MICRAGFSAGLSDYRRLRGDCVSGEGMIFWTQRRNHPNGGGICGAVFLVLRIFTSAFHIAKSLRMCYNADMAKNSNLHSAKAEKNDEFYTQIADIERELLHYRHHFKDKVILCNCDDPRVSNFFKYFVLNFNLFGLKKLISTCYKSKNFDLFSQCDSEKAIYAEYTGSKDDHIPTNDELDFKEFKGDGDFRSAECIELLKQADIVVTNPPFSLFREYVMQLMEYDKKFIIIGNRNALTYKEIFPLIKDNRMWLGNGFQGGDAYFKINESNKRQYADGVLDTEKNVVHFRNCCWYTNLHITKRDEEIILFRHYAPQNYPSYDNYDAIEVSKVLDIPMDYDGIMGVPITFLDRHNPKQFEIIGATESEGKGFSNGLWHSESGIAQPMVNGKRVYKRIFIKKA